MVNTVRCYESIIHKVMKLAGMKPKEVEIEPGTVLHFWVPSKNSNKKPNVVLVHGFAGDGILNWQFQVSSLRKKYNLYIPDVIFFGKSYTNRSDRSVRFQADCLAKGLKMLSVEKCIYVGFSYGGFMGFQMAEHHPELVRSLVAVDTVLALSESITKKRLARIGFGSWAECLMPDTVEGVKVLLEISTFYHSPKMPKFIYKHALESMFGNRKERVELLEALVVKDEDVTKHQFGQNIQLIWGGEDKIFDMEVANNLKEGLGGKTELHIVKKAGHLVQLERPCVFNRCLKQVLKSLVADTKLPSSSA